jgi:hypothetical protein
MKELKEFCHWHRLSYPMTQLQADKVFAELDSAMATENVMEDGEISVEEGEEKYEHYSRIAGQLLKKFKVRPIKNHYGGTFEHFDIEKQKVMEW